MFAAYAIQEGEGCDYTIGCGRILWKLKATTKSEAIRELRRKVIGEWLPEYGEYEEGYWDEDKLSKVTLFEVAHKEKIPLPQWYAEAENNVKQAKIKRDEDRKRKEFERLKAKFG